MCGIAGWANFEENISNKRYIIEKMTDTLNKRGPDDEGIYVKDNVLFGHRRLVVVDPEGGRQPMSKIVHGYDFTLVYNGELYNTDELRKILIDRGYKFNSYSDTEVLLTSYIEFKENCVEYFNGIFAFAIYDNYKKQIFVARDRLGVKPLFYTIKQNNFIFGSQIKTLLAHDMVEPEIEEKGILEIFALGPARTPGCGVFKDIEEVLPGEWMVYNANGLYKKTYWDVKNENHKDNKEQTVEKVRGLVIDAIERQLVSDRPICTFLSGGIDSSIISAVSAKYMQERGLGKLNTFTIDYDGNEKYFTPNLFQPNSDNEYIKIMTDKIGSDHKKVIITQQDLFVALKEAVIANDLPGMADIDSSLLLFCEEVRKKSVVALSGECADEIFGGYPWFTNKSLWEPGTFPWMNSVNLRKSILAPSLKGLKIEEYVKGKYDETIKRMPEVSEESTEEGEMKKLFYLNRLWFMQTLLNRKDRMSMANSLEVRVPFADHRLVEYVWNIPWGMKYTDNQEKGLLREAVRGIIPDEIRLRKKSPYPKTHNPLYTDLVKMWATQIIENDDSPILQLVDRTKIRDMIENVSTGGGTPWFGQIMTGPQTLAYLIQVNVWMEEFGVKIVK